MKKTVGDLKQAIEIIKDETPVILFSNGYKANIELNVAEGALLISADDMPKPSIKVAVEWDGKEEPRYLCNNCDCDECYDCGECNGEIEDNE
jgi:hypothetical protein